MVGVPDSVRLPDSVGAPVMVPDNAAPLMVGEVNVLFVYVSVPASVASVPSKFGIVIVRVVAVVMPEHSNASCLVASPLSCTRKTLSANTPEAEMSDRHAMVPFLFGTVSVRVVPVVMPEASNLTILVTSDALAMRVMLSFV